MSERTKKKSIHQLFTSKIKFRIYNLFEIYRKLTLQEIADKLSRNKSSIHPHIRDLIDLGILKEPKIVDEKRNFILELTEDYQSKIDTIDSEIDLSKGLTSDAISQISQMGVKWMKIEKSLLDEHIEFTKKIQKMNQIPKNFEEVHDLCQDIFKFEQDSKGQIKTNENGLPLNSSISNNSIYYFDEETYKDYRKELYKLGAKYGKIMDQKNESDPDLRRSVCFIAHSMPIEKIIEVNNRKDID
ncbi:hypothetical protein NEF87_001610 [Candidatus Lokiarchaeum ossiferum]|uniref:HTH arsR-type domain-containing protein n=1 Tax=Candidatus Lokiarchaeum ossiferum TaxID=2951803 RepID=A0ABY6HP78_9ARCH|nr:hypothetical protein NEF87_001610 [Candidatus Lokiarchaeum sp. B-35]